MSFQVVLNRELTGYARGGCFAGMSFQVVLDLQKIRHRYMFFCFAGTSFQVVLDRTGRNK